MANTEAFERVEQEFLRLNGQMAAGRITREQFDAALKELMVQDAQGRYWTIGANSGKWYVNDGTKWVEATPPQRPAASIPPSPPVPSPAPPLPPVRPVSPAPTVPSAPPAKSRSRLWIAIVLSLVLLLCVCVLLGCITSGALGAFVRDPVRFFGIPSNGL